jgi:hypothetical protein
MLRAAALPSGGLFYWRSLTGISERSTKPQDSITFVGSGLGLNLSEKGLAVAESEAPSYGKIKLEELTPDALLELRKDLTAEIGRRINDQEKSVRKMRAAFGMEEEEEEGGNGRAAPKAKRGRKAGGTRTAQSPGKHEGMSVGDALGKVMGGVGKKMPSSEIKAAFAKAKDGRNLNFSLLEKAGTVKRVGDEKKKEGQRGRPGGVFEFTGGKKG